jgi:hypothetical protein
MSRYLVIAHQTAASPELVAALKERLQADPDAAFTLLVPATPPAELLSWREGAAGEIAERRALAAQAALAAEGLPVRRAVAGDASPMVAVRQELSRERYDGLVVSTLPVGLSRWLGLDLPHRLERRFRLPVSHVTALPPPEEEAAEASAPCPHGEVAARWVRAPESHNETLVEERVCSACGARLPDEAAARPVLARR